MASQPLHILWTLANNTTAPYFSWFAQRSQTEPSIRFSFLALYPTQPDMVDEMNAIGCSAFWLPFDHLKRGASMINLVRPLVKLLRKIKPDIVHAHLFDDALPVLFAARIAGIPVRMITKGDAAFHWYFAQKGVKYDRLNNRNATHIIALSKESKEFILQKEKADPQKLVLIHHGIPLAEITNQQEKTKQLLRERFGIRKDDIIIATISRFIEWKGYKSIVAAAEILVKENPKLKFLFTGQGDQKAEIEKMIAEKNLGKNILLTGYINRDEMPSYYGMMDIYLHAASNEPFGLVIPEAMLNGVPVVSTSTGASRDAIKSGENGFLVSSPNGELIAEGIRFMLGNNRKQIGEAGRATALEMFTLETMWKNHLALYEKAIGEKQHSIKRKSNR